MVSLMQWALVQDRPRIIKACRAFHADSWVQHALAVAPWPASAREGLAVVSAAIQTPGFMSTCGHTSHLLSHMLHFVKDLH